MTSRFRKAVLTSTILCAWAVIPAGCKSKEDKAREQAQKQFAEAAAQMAEASKVLAKQAAAAGTEAAAQGVQNVAEGAQATAQGIQAAAQAMQQWAQAVKGTQGAPVDPVDFRELRALLPETALGLPRKSAKGEKTGMAGMTISQARGRYGDKDKNLDLRIVDTGGFLGPMAFAAFGLAMVEIDREDDDGYERTATVDGHKVFEKWNAKSRRGEYKILAGGRFIIETDGWGLSMDDLKTAAHGVDIAKLTSLGAKQ